MSPTYSFVIPVFNEEASLEALHRELSAVLDRLDGPSEILFVDDGSTDSSFDVLMTLHNTDSRCSVIRFSRSFGHQMAVTAGMERAAGQAVVVMDADLQDPPAVVLEMAELWREGYDVVYGQRVDRTSDSWLKRSTAAGFYRLLHRCTSIDVPADVGDFRLVDRKVVDAFNGMRESHRYVRGMFSWLGYRQVAVPYTRPARQAGTTHYSVRKMARLAEDGLVGFSTVPLRAILLAGVTSVGVGATSGAIAALAAASGTTAPKALRAVAGPALQTGLPLAAIGIVGAYVGRVLDEALDRPLYVVRSSDGPDEVTRRRRSSDREVISLADATTSVRAGRQ